MMPSARRIFMIMLVGAVLFALVEAVYAEENGAKASDIGEVTLLINNDYYDALLKRIKNAKSEILVSTYIFKTSSMSGPMQELLNQLINASERGVQVKVFFFELSGHDRSLDSSNKETAAKLIKRNIAVCFDSPHITTHSKLVLIDGRFVFVGSHNLTPSALKHNNEVSVLIDSPQMALAIKKYLQKVCRYEGLPK